MAVGIILYKHGLLDGLLDGQTYYILQNNASTLAHIQHMIASIARVQNHMLPIYCLG